MSGNKNIEKLYFDPKQPSSFYSFGKVNESIKKLKNNKITPAKLQAWLESQDAYTLHKHRRLHYPRRNYNVYNIDDVWETDLIDLQSIKSYNDNFNFILVVIDCLSRFAWVQPLQNKTSTVVAAAFRSILENNNNRSPYYIQSDSGKEFTGGPFQKLLKEKEINFRIARSPDVKCAIAERFNRTLKERMWRYFTNFNTKRYIDILQALVNSYNTTVHSGIKMTPNQVDLTNASAARINSEKRYSHYFTGKKPKYKVGELVRISTAKNVFAKAYEGTFTEELFRIARISKNRAPYAYILEDLSGEAIDGIFYEQELTRVRKNLEKDTFIVEKVLATKGRGRNKQYLVHWQGYSSKFDSWVYEKDLVQV